VFDSGTGIGAFGSVLADDEAAVLEEEPAVEGRATAVVPAVDAVPESWSGCGELPSTPACISPCALAESAHAHAHARRSAKRRIAGA
jgi:hypothetical protein